MPFDCGCKFVHIVFIVNIPRYTEPVLPGGLHLGPDPCFLCLRLAFELNMTGTFLNIGFSVRFSFIFYLASGNFTFWGNKSLTHYQSDAFNVLFNICNALRQTLLQDLTVSQHSSVWTAVGGCNTVLSCSAP